MTTEVLIRPTGKFGPKGERYEVIFNGEVILTSPMPEFAACRVLNERGITGMARFWREGKSVWHLQVDIAAGAGRTVTENAKGGPRITKWAPSDWFKKPEDEDMDEAA
jgi:hypothetical protein